MRYTEYDFKIETPADFVRTISGSLILAPFRFMNEYTKRIMFLDRSAVRQHILYAIGINVVLLVVEIVSCFLGRETIVLLDTNIVPCIISCLVLSGYYVASGKLQSFEMTSITEAEVKVTDPKPQPATETIQPEPETKTEPLVEFDSFELEPEPEPVMADPKLYKPTAGLISKELLYELEDEDDFYSLTFKPTPPEIKKDLDESVVRDVFDTSALSSRIVDFNDEMLDRLAEVMENGGI